MSLGIWQLLIILVLFLLLFGAGKVPSVMADIAKGLKVFKENLNNDSKDK